jgi:hypothetical protein
MDGKPMSIRLKMHVGVDINPISQVNLWVAKDGFSVCLTSEEFFYDPENSALCSLDSIDGMCVSFTLYDPLDAYKGCSFYLTIDYDGERMMSNPVKCV